MVKVWVSTCEIGVWACLSTLQKGPGDPSWSHPLRWAAANGRLPATEESWTRDITYLTCGPATQEKYGNESSMTSPGISALASLRQRQFPRSDVGAESKNGPKNYRLRWIAATLSSTLNESNMNLYSSYF